jgi:hypothetical protein
MASAIREPHHCPAEITVKKLLQFHALGADVDLDRGVERLGS